jgi:hypothetical protein
MRHNSVSSYTSHPLSDPAATAPAGAEVDDKIVVPPVLLLLVFVVVVVKIILSNRQCSQQ